MTQEVHITDKCSGQPSVSSVDMDNICQSVILFKKVTKKLSHKNKDFNTLSMTCICLRSLIWYNFITAEGLHISLEYTDVLDNGVFTDTRPPGVKHDPTMKMVITNADFSSFTVKLKYMSTYKRTTD